jgi:hypothetical protein
VGGLRIVLTVDRERRVVARGRTVNGQLLYWLRWLLDEAENGNDPHP